MPSVSSIRRKDIRREITVNTWTFWKKKTNKGIQTTRWLKKVKQVLQLKPYD